jgi:diadenosine tetraphosphate (Ap4A) HIT family hydrolase
MSCELCGSDGGTVLWRDEFCRVVRPTVPGYPAFLRVVLNRHAKEMSDLDAAAQARLLRVVIACESVLRRLYSPDKVNLASLGNVVPHLHWHVIARFADDAHFPDAIWAAPRRPAASVPVDEQRLAAELGEAMMDKP